MKPNVRLLQKHRRISADFRLAGSTGNLCVKHLVFEIWYLNFGI